jgi:hypothetical protein
MPRQSDLYEATEGNILLVYFKLRAQAKNIPPDRAMISQAARKNWDLRLTPPEPHGSLKGTSP